MRADTSATHLKVAAPLLGAGAAVVVAATVRAGARVKDERMRRERLRILQTGIAAVGLLLWPLVWLALGLPLRASAPLLLVAFAFPLVMVGLDLAQARSRSRGTAAEEAQRQAETRAMGDRLIGAVWSLGALLIVLRTTSTRRGGGGDASSGFTRHSARVVLASLLATILFVLPTSDAREEVDRIAAYQAQRCALQYAVALFAAGVLVVVTPSPK